MTIAPPPTAPNPNTAKPAIIAGRHAGKPIYCAPEVYPVFQQLEKAEKQGNHWARIAMKELGSLTTGHIGKNNVFVEESPHLRRHRLKLQTNNCPHIKHSIELFYAFLPGLQATIAQRPDGSYFVVELVTDNRYFEATKEQRPGLYHVSKGASTGGWETKYAETGQPRPEKNRAVAIADTSYSSPDRAAMSVAPHLTRVGGPLTKTTLESDGFDLHFTPGHRRLGGLINYNALTAKSVHGSAVLLADSMYTARKAERVNWIADLGGSAILTQAMKILAARRATLEGHSLYLYRPKTSPGDATRLAHQLKLTLEDDFAKTGFDLTGGISKSRVARARLDNHNDPYDMNAHFKANMVGLGKLTTVAGIGIAVGSGFGAAYPAVAAITAVVAKAAGATSLALGTGAVAQHLLEPHAHKFQSKRITKR